MMSGLPTTLAFGGRYRNRLKADKLIRCHDGRFRIVNGGAATCDTSERTHPRSDDMTLSILEYLSLIANPFAVMPPRDPNDDDDDEDEDKEDDEDEEPPTVREPDEE